MYEIAVTSERHGGVRNPQTHVDSSSISSLPITTPGAIDARTRRSRTRCRARSAGEQVHVNKNVDVLCDLRYSQPTSSPCWNRAASTALTLLAVFSAPYCAEMMSKPEARGRV
jgi:hypothetical protein